MRLPGHGRSAPSRSRRCARPPWDLLDNRPEECDRAAARRWSAERGYRVGRGCWFAGRIQRRQLCVDVDAASPIKQAAGGSGLLLVSGPDSEARPVADPALAAGPATGDDGSSERVARLGVLRAPDRCVRGLRGTTDSDRLSVRVRTPVPGSTVGAESAAQPARNSLTT